MALVARQLTLDHWRNASARRIDLSPSMTILVGPNASGKTNAVEAIQLLSSGTSFRRPRPSQLLQRGAPRGRAALELVGDGRFLEVECQVDDRSKRFTRNAKAVRPSTLAGTLPSVLFCPDDLMLVKGSASLRRDEVDDFAAQVNRGYGRVLRAYRRSVEQRNRLLKEPWPDQSLLAAWDESVTLGAATLLLHRTSLVARLADLASSIYATLSGGETLEVGYLSSVGPLEPDMDREEIQAQVARALEASREEDLRRAMTLVGPHRDDIALTLEGDPARSYASQGQARTIVLAWKLAQVRFCEEQLGVRPMLLLDDVMSELDDGRRQQVSEVVQRGIQTVITTTHLGYFTDRILEGAEVVPFGEED